MAGNIRDLERAIKAARLAAEGESVLSVAHLPESVRGAASLPPAAQEQPPQSIPPQDVGEAPSKKEQREDVRRYYNQTGNARKAADLAGVKRSTAHRWLKEDGLLGDDEH